MADMSSEEVLNAFMEWWVPKVERLIEYFDVAMVEEFDTAEIREDVFDILGIQELPYEVGEPWDSSQ